MKLLSTRNLINLIFTLLSLLLSLFLTIVFIITDDKILLTLSLVLLFMVYVGLFIISDYIITNIRSRRIIKIHKFILSDKIIDLVANDKFSPLTIDGIYNYYIDNYEIEIGMNTVYNSLYYTPRNNLIMNMRLPGLKYLFRRYNEV